MTLVPFIGAGVSRLGNCPSWVQLADNLLAHLVKESKLSEDDRQRFNHLSPRIKLSIALDIADGRVSIPWEPLLQPDGISHRDGQRVYAALGKVSNIFMTTNQDRWLDQKIPPLGPDLSPSPTGTNPGLFLPRKCYWNPADFRPSLLNEPDTVIHLHGSLEHTPGMVLSQLQYSRLYATDKNAKTALEENRTLTLLEYLFRLKTVLFIGYGLEEQEILEFVILKAKHAVVPHVEGRHFFLQGYKAGEERMMEVMRAYYLRQCGLHLLPFLLDEGSGWLRLIDVLDDMATKLPASTPMVAQDFTEMAELLK